MTKQHILTNFISTFNINEIAKRKPKNYAGWHLPEFSIATVSTAITLKLRKIRMVNFTGGFRRENLEQISGIMRI